MNKREEEEFLEIERERYCNTQCHAETMDDCIFVDIVYVQKNCVLGENL